MRLMRARITALLCLAAAVALRPGSGQALADAAKPPAGTKLPPQPREWVAPAVDLTPPPAPARWSGGWTRGRDLPLPLAGHKAVAVGQRLYVVGGVTGRESLGSRDVLMTTVGKDGALGPWKKLSPLPTPVAFGAAVTARGRLYWLGGSSREGMQLLYDKAWSAALKPDGTLSAWREERPLPDKLQHHAAAVLGDVLYVLGGFNGQEYNEALRYAPLAADGTIGAWKDATGRYPHRVGRTSLQAAGGALYVTGGLWSDSQGEHITSLVRRGAPGPDGDVKAWEDMGGLKIASRSLRFSLAEEAGATDGAFVYAVGGRDPDALGVPTVQASWLNPRKGVLTRWQNGPDLPLYGAKGAPQAARVYESSAAIVGDRLVVLGGYLYVRELTPAVWVMALSPYAEPAWLKTRKP